jgi:hypothetical protein
MRFPQIERSARLQLRFSAVVLFSPRELIAILFHAQRIAILRSGPSIDAFRHRLLFKTQAGCRAHNLSGARAAKQAPVTGRGTSAPLSPDSRRRGQRIAVPSAARWGRAEFASVSKPSPYWLAPGGSYVTVSLRCTRSGDPPRLPQAKCLRSRRPYCLASSPIFPTIPLRIQAAPEERRWLCPRMACVLWHDLSAMTHRQIA